MVMRLYVLNPDVVFAARVNQAGGTYPIADLEFDTVTTGAYGDIEAGMTMFLGSTAGAHDLGMQRIRAAATSDTVYFGRSSRGVHAGEMDVTDNAYITILNDYRVWAKIGYIATDGTIYKDHNITVSTRTGAGTPPICNIGVGFCATIDSVTSKITAAWDASTNSQAMADGASISSYAWDVDDGTITVGTAASSAITATFPAGFRWVKCTVTDSNSNTHTARVPVFARNPASDDTISAFQINSHRITPQGQTMTLVIREALPEGTYPDGSLVMVWEDEPADEDDRSHMVFIGWQHDTPEQIESGRTGVLSDTTLECLDVGGKLDTLPGFSQEVEGKNNPAVWTEMRSPNMDKYLHYLLHWHSTAIDVADFIPSGTGSDFPFVILGSQGESLFDQVDRRAQALVPDYFLTCNRLGQLQVMPDPMLQDTGDRTGTVQATVNLDDWRAISYKNKQPHLHWHRGNAIHAHPTVVEAFFCVAPGESPGQGLSANEHGEQLAQSQNDLNACEGHRYARLNAPESHFSIELNDSDLRDLDPAEMSWVQVTVTAAVAAKRGLAFTEDRGLVHEINVSYTHGREGLIKTISLDWERETVGTPAVTYYPDSGTYIDWNWYWGELPMGELFGIIYQGMTRDVDDVILPNTDGYLYTASDFNTTPSWSRADMGLSGTPQSFTPDPFSPIYMGTGDELNGWIVTTSDIYRGTDLLGSPGYSSQKTFSGSTDVWRSIKPSITQDGHVVVISYYGADGTYCTYTTDSGTTWSAEAAITSYNDTTSTNIHWPALHMSHYTPGLCYAFAFTATGTGAALTSDLYQSTDYGASWAASTILNDDADDSLGATMHFPWYNNENEDTVYYLNYQQQFRLYRTEGTGSPEDVSPVSGDTTFGPERFGWTIDSSMVDDNLLMLIGAHERGYRSVLISQDRGDSWINMGNQEYTYTVTFETGGYPAYEITHGVISGGELAIIPNTDNLARVIIYFPEPVKVQELQIDVYYDGASACAVDAWFGDINDDQIALNFDSITEDSTWVCDENVAYGTPPPHEGVKWVRCAISGDIGSNRSIDNIQITCVDESEKPVVYQYTQGMFSSNDNQTVYLWGEDGYIGKSTDLMNSVTDLREGIASMTSPDPGEFIGIAGG